MEVLQNVHCCFLVWHYVGVVAFVEIVVHKLSFSFVHHTDLCSNESVVRAMHDAQYAFASIDAVEYIILGVAHNLL